MLKIAVYPSDHGFGHAARMAALAQEFVSLGIQVRIRSTRPDYLFNCLDSPFCSKDDIRNDLGVLHTAGLKADLSNTKASLINGLSVRSAIVEREVNWLRSEEISLVIADLPYLVIEACSYAGIPVMAVSNFDWVFIYSRLFKQDQEMRPVINTIHSLYQRCDAAFRLPFSSSQSMKAFRSTTKTGLLARRKEHYNDIRNLYKMDRNTPILSCTFGGEPGLSVDLKSVCAAWPGTVISANQDLAAPNHIFVPRHDDWLDVIHGSDLILTKPGYSTFAEATQFNIGIIYLPREDYPEEEVLIRGLRSYPSKLEVRHQVKGVREWKRIFGSFPTPGKANPAFRNQNSRVAADILNAYFKLIASRSNLTGVFDMGSNNLNYLLWDARQKQVLHTAHYTTRLARLENPAAIKSFKTTIRKLIASFGGACEANLVIAASVARDNDRFDQLSKWFERHYKLKTKILNQQQEARLAFLAVKKSLKLTKKPLVIDIGGLSTELIWGLERDRWYGANLGLLNLGTLVSKPSDLPASEASGAMTSKQDSPAILPEARQRCELLSMLPNIPDASEMQLVLTGLTGTLLASIINKKSPSLPWEFHDARLTRRQIDQLASSLANNVAEDWEPYLQPDTPTSILESSLGLVSILMDKYAASEIVVCYYGISLGQVLKK